MKCLNIWLALMNMEWVSDSSALIFNAGDRGDAPFFKVNIDTGAVEILHSGTFKSMDFDVSANGGIAFVASTPTNPGELYWLPPGASESQQFTGFNDEWLEGVVVQETQEMWFASPSGKQIQGWYILPVGYEEGQKYPLALNIHGGPRAMWGPSEHTMQMSRLSISF